MHMYLYQYYQLVGGTLYTYSNAEALLRRAHSSWLKPHSPVLALLIPKL